MLKIFEGSAEDMSKLERRLQKENKQSKYIPEIKFLGSQECFNKVYYGGN